MCVGHEPTQRQNLIPAMNFSKQQQIKYKLAMCIKSLIRSCEKKAGRKDESHLLFVSSPSFHLTELFSFFFVFHSVQMYKQKLLHNANFNNNTTVDVECRSRHGFDIHIINVTLNVWKWKLFFHSLKSSGIDRKED